MEVWIKQNALGLFMAGCGLVAVYAKTSGDMRVVQQELIASRIYAARLQEMENEVVLIRAGFAARKEYWDRFENILADNTKVLNKTLQTLSRFDGRVEDNTRRIEKLEK